MKSNQINRKQTSCDAVDKVQYIVEQKIKAEDYEAAIVIGWHENNGSKFNLSSSGISPKVYKAVMSNQQALDAGKLMAQKIAKRTSRDAPRRHPARPSRGVRGGAARPPLARGRRRGYAAGPSSPGDCAVR